MIELDAPLEIKAAEKGTWQLVFWIFDAFNYTIPFRAMLDEVADALGQDRRTDLDLLPYEEGEDFVEGALKFGDVQLGVYYEYSLSYLKLTSDDEATIREAAKRIEPRVVVNGPRIVDGPRPKWASLKPDKKATPPRNRMNSFRSLTTVIDRKSLIVSALALLSTWLCLRYRITADFPLTLIATAIVFPLVFSISTAYGRREKVLENYAAFKAHGRAIFLAGRDWLPEPHSERTTAIRAALQEMMEACRELVSGSIDDLPAHEARVYGSFGLLSECVELLRKGGLSPNECSRCNQYIAHIMTAFENIKHIYKYRTPRTLRAFRLFFILVLPILYGPYFADQALHYRPGLGYVMPVLFTLILVGLSNIQDHLENPFDQIGADDVAIDPERYVKSLGE